jgi:hypothetical protein
MEALQMSARVEQPEAMHELCYQLHGQSFAALTAVRHALSSDAHFTKTAAHQLMVLSNQLVVDGQSVKDQYDARMAEHSRVPVWHESESTLDVRHLWEQLLPLAITAPVHTVRMLVEHAVANLQQVDLVVALLRLLPSLSRCGEACVAPVPASPSYVAAALAAVLQLASNVVPSALLLLVTRLVVHDATDTAAPGLAQCHYPRHHKGPRGHAADTGMFPQPPSTYTYMSGSARTRCSDWSAHSAGALLSADDALINVVIPELHPEAHHLDTVLRLAHVVVFGSALIPLSATTNDAPYGDTVDTVAAPLSRSSVPIILLQALLLSTAGKRGPRRDG